MDIGLNECPRPEQVATAVALYFHLEKPRTEIKRFSIFFSKHGSSADPFTTAVANYPGLTQWLRLEVPFEAARQSSEYNPSDRGFESNDHLELFQDWFVDLFCNNDGFVMLLDTAASQMVLQAFQATFSILFTQYSNSLGKTSGISFEEDAARFVHDQCQQMSRAVWVKMQSEGDSPEE